MRVAFITHYTELYGANRSLLNLIDGLKEYGIVAYVVTPQEGQITDALQARNVQFAVIPIQRWVAPLKLEGNPVKKLHQLASYYRKAAKRLYLNLKLNSPLAALLKSWNIDVVYTNSLATPAGAFAAEKLNLPHVWHLREFIDLDYGLHHDWGKAAFNYFLNKATAKIAISKAIYSYFAQGSTSNAMHVIYNGVASTAEFDRFYKLGTSSLRDSTYYTFALVGVIHSAKGQDVAIKSLALLAKDFPHVRLLIVGKGETTSLKELADELGILDKVEFWGHVDDPYKAYLCSDVVLMCSQNEGMGRVTVEAMSACRPVVGYDNAGTSEIIQHEQTGLLYRGGPEALATCMRRCVENRDWARQLGENASCAARKKYSVEAYSQRVHAVLLSVTKKEASFAKHPEPT
jgi:glycosyltransferase involved in cell wall biosynthesis